MNACFRHASAAKKLLYAPELIWSVQTAVQEFFFNDMARVINISALRRTRADRG